MSDEIDSCVRTAAATLHGMLGLGGLAAELVVVFERLKAERDAALGIGETAAAKARLRTATQALIELVGADGPMDLEDAIARTATKVRALEGALEERETHAEALVEIVHDTLWSEQHRNEDVGDMAKRVKAALDEMRERALKAEHERDVYRMCWHRDMAKGRDALAVTQRAVSNQQDAVDAEWERAEKAERALGSLLAIIHRDGGHHQARVGAEQAVKDAHERWGRLIALADRAEVAERALGEARGTLASMTHERDALQRLLNLIDKSCPSNNGSAFDVGPGFRCRTR